MSVRNSTLLQESRDWIRANSVTLSLTVVGQKMDKHIFEDWGLKYS